MNIEKEMVSFYKNIK